MSELVNCKKRFQRWCRWDSFSTNFYPRWNLVCGSLLKKYFSLRFQTILCQSFKNYRKSRRKNDFYHNKKQIYFVETIGGFAWNVIGLIAIILFTLFLCLLLFGSLSQLDWLRVCKISELMGCDNMQVLISRTNWFAVLRQNIVASFIYWLIKWRNGSNMTSLQILTGSWGILTCRIPGRNFYNIEKKSFVQGLNFSSPSPNSHFQQLAHPPIENFSPTTGGAPLMNALSLKTFQQYLISRLTHLNYFDF